LDAKLFVRGVNLEAATEERVGGACGGGHVLGTLPVRARLLPLLDWWDGGIAAKFDERRFGVSVGYLMEERG
jgi:hypothetical protein